MNTNHTASTAPADVVYSTKDGFPSRPISPADDAVIMKQTRVSHIVVHLECQGAYGVDRLYTVALMRMTDRRVWTYAEPEFFDDMDDAFDGFAAAERSARFILKAS